ncbi:heme A synthase [Kroppenstedtia eburnea]|uniref:Heme A synthase n=1 Tax=Kroppenstedtia eburnea TaxID=714067 RepID=A0A1N7INI8_9BACL|nr:heme A synthase [Kroppenstedtia eburnea]EGK14162.1 cytochrome c oxidase assembly protein [Desmospora sp. 8437]QKI82010.1 heme A synthase [Kroppenstedtia eburnea]SIS38645.1 cytochrome c oxidase assembly protein subunit 15 [Kroppenstedtia eburnea]
MNRTIRGMSILGAAGTLLIVLMGALVTKTGSADGCGNTWPFCHGEIFPSYHTLELWIEYSHRIVSGLVGLIVVVASVGAWLLHKQNFTVKFLAFNSVFFIVLQGLLGAAAVIWGQSDAVLALHFGFSLISFASVLLLAVVLIRINRQGPSRGGNASTVSRQLKYGIWGLAVYTYVVVYTGAYVRHTGSSLGCADWPLCGSKWVPDLFSQVGIQLTHRLLAGLLFLFAVWLWWAVRKKYPHRKDLNRGARWSLILTLLQVLTGGAIVLTKLELMVALAHATLVCLFFSAVCYLCMQVGPPWKDHRDSSSLQGKQGDPLTP